MGLILGIKNRIGRVRQGALLSYLKWFLGYKTRVEADSVTVQDETISKQILRHLQNNGRYENVKLILCAGGGLKTRASGVNLYVSKAYDMGEADEVYQDATQTTESLQLAIGNNIAPNEQSTFKNANGEIRHLTHPEISFASDEAWSITFVSNSTQDNLLAYINGKVNYGGIRIRTDGRLEIVSDTVNVPVTSTGVYEFGKNMIVTFTVDNGALNVYVGGILVFTGTILGGFTTEHIFKGRSSGFSGTLPLYIIESGAITQSQISNDATFLGSLYPEIPTVQIGTQVWTTSNWEAVTTPMGNVIQEMQNASAIELVLGGDFESGLIATLLTADETATWTLNTSSPISATQDGLLQVTGVGTNQYRPALYFDGITRVPDRWRKCRFDYKVNSGNCKFSLFNTGGSTTNKFAETLTGNGAVEFCYKADGTLYPVLYFDGINTFNVQFDNISDKQLGWADSQELYDGLIAQGYSAADALKEVAEWCYHNNDSARGEVFGKIYNGFGRTQLVNDIATKGDWGYHVATEAELTTLALQGGYKLKVAGTGYWNTDNGTNQTGFTALGGGTRSDVDGSFSALKDTTAFWCADSDKVLLLNHADNTATITAVNKGFGAYIRLVKDS
ncbi:FISUMP domain-containing protein [Mariniphaga sediminis]|uniref:FISUMP domain-containing protein n=1 Tax=Mariniphaga sediminis TaxID=1628158 RepID=UPI003564179C